VDYFIIRYSITDAIGARSSCRSRAWSYMSFRFWIGTWITVILVILVAFDASACVCYITRFTEENFATLIAFIFIYKVFSTFSMIACLFDTIIKSAYTLPGRRKCAVDRQEVSLEHPFQRNIGLQLLVQTAKHHSVVQL